MKIAVPLVLIMLEASALQAAPSTLSFGVHRGTGKVAAANDEPVRLRLTEIATGLSLQCTEARDTAVVECGIADGSFSAPGRYELVVENAPTNGGRWTAALVLPPNVISTALTGAVTLGPRRPGLTLVETRVLVEQVPSVRLTADQATEGVKHEFQITNNSTVEIAIETSGGKPVGRLFRTYESGERRRYVGPLDECFEPILEPKAAVRPGQSVDVAVQSTTIPLVPGSYAFVARYRKTGSVPTSVGGDFPLAEVEVTFSVK